MSMIRKLFTNPLPFLALAYFALRFMIGLNYLLYALDLLEHQAMLIAVAFIGFIVLLFYFNKRGETVAKFLPDDVYWIHRTLLLLQIFAVVYLCVDLFQSQFLLILSVEIVFQVVNFCVLCIIIELSAIDNALRERSAKSASG